MDEKQKSRRPRIGERRDNFGRGNSDNGYKKPFNRDSRPNNSYGSEYRTSSNNRNYSSRTEGERRYESNNYSSYREDRRPQQRNFGEERRYNSNGGYKKPFNRDNREEGYKPRANKFEKPTQYNSPKPQKAAPKAKAKKSPEPLLYKAPFSPDEPIRLNKYLSTAGVCSRREADEMIQRGEVKVNGNKITELGTKILFGDIVTIKDKVVTPEHKVYVLLNKPKNCVTTMSDPEGRLTVMDLIRKACPERIFPVGRLDRNTTGVLLLTNDGELASKLTHPQYVKKKIYYVCTDKDVTEEDMQRIADGIELSDGPIHADAISYATETDKDQIGIEIHSGRNRIVRRIFESLGYKVKKLDRVYFAGLTKKDLPRGRWRYLTKEEVGMLHMGAFE